MIPGYAGIEAQALVALARGFKSGSMRLQVGMAWPLSAFDIIPLTQPTQNKMDTDCIDQLCANLRLRLGHTRSLDYSSYSTSTGCMYPLLRHA